MSMAHHAHEPILDMNAPQGIPCDVTRGRARAVRAHPSAIQINLANVLP